MTTYQLFFEQFLRQKRKVIEMKHFAMSLLIEMKVNFMFPQDKFLMWKGTASR